MQLGKLDILSDMLSRCGEATLSNEDGREGWQGHREVRLHRADTYGTKAPVLRAL